MRRAFTLVELLVAIAIVAVLVVCALPAFRVPVEHRIATPRCLTAARESYRFAIAFASLGK